MNTAELEEQQLLRTYRENRHLLDRHDLAYEACRRRRNQLKKDCEAKDAEIERLRAEVIKLGGALRKFDHISDDALNNAQEELNEKFRQKRDV